MSCQSPEKSREQIPQGKILPIFNPDPRAESPNAYLQIWASKWEKVFQEESSSSLDKAKAAIITGKYSEAMAKASESLKKNRKSKEAMAILAEAQIRQQNFAYAEVILQGKMFKVKDSQSENLKGINAYLQRDFASARRFFQSASDLDSQSNAAALNLSLLAIASRRFDHAQDILEGLGKKHALNPDIMIHRGVVAALLDKPSAGEAFYRKAIEIDEKHALAHYNLAMASLKQGDKLQHKNSLGQYANLAKTRRLPLPRSASETQIGH
jgi:Flp pilus assembly protein TadD